MTKFNSPFPNQDLNSHKNKTLRIFCKTFVYAFAILGIFFIIMMLSLLSMLHQNNIVKKPVPKNAIIHIDLDRNFPEAKVDDLLTDLAEMDSTSFYDLLFAINIAAFDDNVKAITANIGNSPLGLSQIQELRKTIKLFRSKGKKAYIHSTGFGTFGGGTSEYYAATAFDEIWLQPTSDVGITGMSFEVPFFKDLFEKIGVNPEFYTRHEYKNATASLTSSGFSPEFKSQLTGLGSNIFNFTLMEISSDRNISTSDLKKLVDNAPIFAETALKKHLIDKIGYKNELNDIVKMEFSGEIVSIDTYSSNITKIKNKNKKIAYMVMEGVIDQGKSTSNPIRGESIIGSETIIKQIENIKKDQGVKALVIRINSPGGSYTASNEIWFALKQLKEQKKIPIVISMGDYAASGGYFIALSGDYVYAEPSTITGSIGVLGGKIVLQDLWKKLGLNWGEIKFGNNASLLSTNHKFSDNEKRIFNRSLDNIYQDFTTKVSQARNIDIKNVDKLARGRVWTGTSAADHNLIDALGGIDNALGKARDLAGITEDDTFEISRYPAPKTFAEKLQDVIQGGRRGAAANVINELGIDFNKINMLKHLNYDTIMLPMEIKY